MTETAGKRTPTEREGGPVLRWPIRGGGAPLTRPQSIGPPVSRPPATTEHWECAGMVTGRAQVTKPSSRFYNTEELTDAELGRSIVLTVALPAFAVGCVVGMLL